jgi:hypothetical protein
MPETTATVLKAFLKSFLTAINGVGQVEDYPNQDFNTWPGIEVLYSGNTSNYLSTTENDIVYSYTLFIYQIVEGAIDRKKARLILEELSDTIADSIDSNEFLDGVSLPTNKTMIGVRPTTVEIAEDEEGKFIVAKMEIATRITKTV